MPSTPGRTNRIEVDLKLLQDGNIQKLKEFGAQFDKSVLALTDTLSTYADRLAGIVGVEGGSGAGKPGPDATVAKPSVLATRQGGTEAPTLVNAPPGSPPQSPGGGSIADQGGVENGPNAPRIATGPGTGLPGIEEQYVRAQRYIGSVPVGLRQTLGYIAEGQFYGQSPEEAKDEFGNVILDEQGRTTYKRDEFGHLQYSAAGIGPFKLSQQTAQSISNNLQLGQSIGSNAGLLMQHFSNIRSGILGYTQTGMNLGAPRTDSGFWGGIEGMLGGIGGPAFRMAAGQTWDALKSSMFGVDPNFSPQQAQQVKQAIQGYGYGSGGTYNWLSDSLKSLWIHQNITPDAAMSVLDPSIRFGGSEDLSQLTDILQAIPGAAKAARMNLQDFTAALVQTAQSVSQTTGMTVANAASGIMAYSTVTGLNPAEAQTLMSNPQNYLLASGMTGQSIWQLTAGHNNMAPLMSFGMTQFAQSVGNLTPAQIAAGLKAPKNSAAYQQANQVMSRAQLLYLQNPQIFGGQSPREMLNQGLRAGSWQGVLNRVSVVQQLEADNTSKHIDFANLIGKYGGTVKQKEKWESDMEAAMGHVSAKGKTQAEYQQARTQAARKKLLADFQGAAGQAGKKAAEKITIGLTGDGARWFKIMEAAYGSGNKSDTNQYKKAAAYARHAMNNDALDRATNWTENEAVDIGRRGVDSIANLFG